MHYHALDTHRLPSEQTSLKYNTFVYTSYNNWQIVHTNAGPFCTLGRKAVSTFSIAIQPAFLACIAKSVDLFCMTTFWEVLS